MKVVKLTNQGKVAIFLLVVGFALLGNFAFSTWENANAYKPNYSVAGAAEFFGVTEEDVVQFDYELAGKTWDAYAVQTAKGIQVALPDFTQHDGDDWKWMWLKDTMLSDVVLDAMNK